MGCFFYGREKMTNEKEKSTIYAVLEESIRNCETAVQRFGPSTARIMFTGYELQRKEYLAILPAEDISRLDKRFSEVKEAYIKKFCS